MATKPSLKRPAASAGSDGPDAKRPSAKGTYFPIMGPNEVASITVPIQEAPSRLKAVMEEYGFAVVTGCADAAECARLEAVFTADLQELLVQDDGSVDYDVAQPPQDTVVRCAGTTKAGERCKATSKDAGLLAKYAKPLKNGAKYCTRHTPLQLPRAPGENAISIASLTLSSWPSDVGNALGQSDRCVLRGLPQSKFAWECRLLRTVRSCFETLYGTSQLVTSLDNTFFAPPSAPEQRTNREWPHVDFNTTLSAVKGWDCYQSVLYVWPSTDSRSSSTVVWPRSHKQVHKAMMSDPKCPRHHFVEIAKLSEAEQQKLLPRWRREAKRVPVPAGALLIWDSRTVHQGWTGGPRLAHPICWEPSTRRDGWALDKKLRLSALGFPSSHWASLGIPHPCVIGTMHLPMVQKLSIDSARLLLKSIVEPAPLRDGCTARDAWLLLSSSTWDKPLVAETRTRLEKMISPEILSVL